MGRIVIVGYRPKPGKEQALDELMETHISILRSEGLVTDRPAIVMKAADGTVLEVFEWKSKAAIEAAHSNQTVAAIWAKYAEVCEYVPVASVAECQSIFSEFTACDA